MESARSIALFGIGASLLVAHDLQLKLLRLDMPAMLSDDLHTQLLCARNLGKDDLAIVVSYSGMTEDILRCARIARGNGATIISITRGSFESPLLALSDVVLGVAATEFVVRSGAMSSRIAQLNVVDVLFTAYVSSNYEKSMERLSKNWIKRSEVPEKRQAPKRVPGSDRRQKCKEKGAERAMAEEEKPAIDLGKLSTEARNPGPCISTR